MSAKCGAQDNWPAPWRVCDRDGKEPRQSDSLVFIFDANGNRVAQWVPVEIAHLIAAAPLLADASKP